MTSIPFNEIGARYDEAFTDRAPQNACTVQLVAGLAPGARILDHGCGSGWPTAVQLAELGFRVVGTDESDVMLELARRRVPDGDFQLRDLRDLGDELGTFDAIASYLALLMLPRADVPATLRGLAARLRPGGRLAVGMVLGDIDMLEISFLGVPVKVTAYPPDDLAALVADAGFTVDSTALVEVDAEPGRVETQVFLLATKPT